MNLAKQPRKNHRKRSVLLALFFDLWYNIIVVKKK